MNHRLLISSTGVCGILNLMPRSKRQGRATGGAKGGASGATPSAAVVGPQGGGHGNDQGESGAAEQRTGGYPSREQRRAHAVRGGTRGGAANGDERSWARCKTTGGAPLVHGGEECPFRARLRTSCVRGAHWNDVNECSFEQGLITGHRPAGVTAEEGNLRPGDERPLPHGDGLRRLLRWREADERPAPHGDGLRRLLRWRDAAAATLARSRRAPCTSR